MIRPSKVIAALNAFLDEGDGWKRGDAKVYTRREWRERGEPYGNDAICTMVIDGSPMYGFLNYGEDGWKIQTRFYKLIESLGCWYEQGYGWTVHVYRQDRSLR